MRTLFLLLLSCSALTCVAQDMSKGFRLLETGAYDEAKIYFAQISTAYPENQTALICYGRALGLSGESKAAKNLFADLDASYPNHYEIGLNYAESLLWNKEYRTAKKKYQDLLARDSNSFSAMLGYANTLSNLKAYDEALLAVDKALELQPDNTNALTSKKYIVLGMANQYSIQGHHTQAIDLLQDFNADISDDIELKTALANTYLTQKSYDKADEIFSRLTDSIRSYTGRSLVAHLSKNDKKALFFALKAMSFISRNKVDQSRYLDTKERYIQSLIWNGKYSKAKEAIKKITKELPDNTRVGSLRATLGMYTGKITNSKAEYQNILRKDSMLFDGNLGIANAYRAQGNLDKAYAYAKKTLSHHPNQKDALTLIKSLETSLAPALHSTTAYTKDNGDNEAYATRIYLTLPISERLRSTLGYDYRMTENKNIENSAINTRIGLGLAYRLHNNTWLETNLDLIEAKAQLNSYNQLNGSIFIKSRPLPLQYIAFGYSRNLQDFNASLLEQRIFIDNYTLNYNMGTTFNLGWYTSLIHSHQTDGNSRNLLFTSLYYTFTKLPSIKAGINYQYLSFKDQIPELYFSPSSYKATELFLDLNGNSGSWTYSATMAGGLQRVEQDEATTLFRASAKVNYTISNRWQIGGYAKYSNIASATATGFEFTEIGFTLRWQLSKKAIFSL